MDPPALAAPPKAASPNGARLRRRPALPIKTHVSRRKIFLVKKSNDSSVDPKNYFGTERAPPQRSPMPMRSADGLLAILNYPGEVGAEATLHPQPPGSPRITNPRDRWWPGILCNPTVRVSVRSLPFPPSGRVCYTEEAC